MQETAIVDSNYNCVSSKFSSKNSQHPFFFLLIWLISHRLFFMYKDHVKCKMCFTCHPCSLRCTNSNKWFSNFRIFHFSSGLGFHMQWRIQCTMPEGGGTLKMKLTSFFITHTPNFPPKFLTLGGGGRGGDPTKFCKLTFSFLAPWLPHTRIERKMQFFTCFVSHGGAGDGGNSPHPRHSLHETRSK